MSTYLVRGSVALRGGYRMLFVSQRPQRKEIYAGRARNVAPRGRKSAQEAVFVWQGPTARYNQFDEHSCPTIPKSTLAPASTQNCPRSKPGRINFPATLSPRDFPNTPPSAPRPVSPTSAPSPSNTCPKKIASSSKR